MTPINSSFDIIVVGAGIAGLTCAARAKKAGATVLVIEKSHHAGGVIQSVRHEGFLLEFGPNTVQMKPEIFELIRNLELDSELQIADRHTPRYIQFNGKLHLVPLSPFALLRTNLLSPLGKFRLLREPFVPARKKPSDESLMKFFTRRLGKEVAERLMAPFVSGVWAGDPDELSTVSTFPKLAEWEQQGNLFKGALSSDKKKAEQKDMPRGLLSFKEGLETLPKALAKQLHGQIEYGVCLNDIHQGPTGGWEIKTEKILVQARKLILTVPAWEAAKLVRPFAPEASATLNNIAYAPVVVLHMGFHKKDIANPMNGFGYLVAPSEESDILGCLWNSGLFSGRAPAGKALLTIFMGGARNKSMLDCSDSELINKATLALRHPMKLKGEPVFTRITRYDRALPQYTLGHEDRMQLLTKTEQQHTGLHFRGNYRGGISVGDVVKNQFQNSF